MQCRNCHYTRANRPRGLCSSCYYRPGVRERHPISPRRQDLVEKAKGDVDFSGGYTLPAPTDAAPGSEAKIAVLTERVKAKTALHHPHDEKVLARKPTCLVDLPRSKALRASSIAGVLKPGSRRRKIEVEDIDYIRAKRKAGWVLKKIAGAVGLSISSVSRILSGERWAFVG